MNDTTSTVDVEDSNKPLKAYVRFYMSGNEKEVITKCKRLLQNEGIIWRRNFLTVYKFLILNKRKENLACQAWTILERLCG